MTLPGQDLTANTQLVAIAAIAKMLNSTDIVGPTLPKTNADGSSSWGQTGFVQVQPLSGARNPEVPMRAPIVAIDVWGRAKPGSNKAPWARINNLCEIILDGAQAWKPQRIVLPNNYPNARLYAITGNTEPRRIPDLEAYAHMSFHLNFFWSPL